jgi:fatty acid desaturase
VSGWDQEYDLQDWARDVQYQAERLQKTNKVMRWMYLITAAFLLILGIVFLIPMLIVVGGLFFVLFLWNERLIRQMRKAGIK